MSVEFFLDTNVLLYAATANPAERGKQDIAYELIAAQNFGISTQVLQEFYYNATRKAGVKMRPAKALEWLDELAHLPCSIVDAAVFRQAVAISTRFKISYWNGAILAAAEALGSTTVYSEDFSHGQAYGSIKVVNPFRSV